MATAKKAAPKKALAANQRKTAAQGKMPVPKVLPPVWQVDYDGGSISVRKDGEEEFYEDIMCERAECGCAIGDFSGLSVFEDAFNEIPKTIANRRDMIKNAMVNCFTDLKKEDKLVYIVCSNNDRSPNAKIINGIMDEICETATRYKVSPKTKSNIRVWVV